MRSSKKVHRPGLEKKAPAMARKFKHSLEKYAEIYGVNLGTVKKWSAAGWNLDDRQEVLKRVGEQKIAPDSLKDQSHADIKRQKDLLACEKLQFQIEVEKGKFIERLKVRESGSKLGALFDAEYAALLSDLPGLLAGMTEVEIRSKLLPKFEQSKAKLKAELAAL